MTSVEVTIEGHTPLLLNNFGDSITEGATSGAIQGDKGTPLEQATKKLYVGTGGDLMVPQPNLFRCVIDACKYFKNGKSKVTTVKSSIIPACVEIEGIEIPLEHNEPWNVDTRAVRIPSTGGRILCHRPCFNDWRLSFVLNVDTDLMPIKLMREIVDAAGKRIGLGDFRPDCKGPFGKFVVTRWEVESLEAVAA